ncbi:VetSC (plasmid) [Salmonella enterica subsp. enterica serovar Infantis str. 119944]|nr:VetSC [Salmonella enterica subsp. enterica serovar Infantis str. 119944]
MELHLPAELRAIYDLSTLKLESGSFVEDDLRQYFSNVLYSLKTTAGDGYIHVLIEHQSTPDKHMAFRLLRYAVAAMQRHLEAGHKKLPLVIPVLFCTAKRSRIRTPPGGWMSLTLRRWQANSTAAPSRWLMLPSFRMSTSPDIAIYTWHVTANSSVSITFVSTHR